MSTQDTDTTEEMIKAVIVLSVAEVVTSRFPVTVEAPAAVAARGPEALAEYIATNKGVQLGEMPVEEERRVFVSLSGRDVSGVTSPAQGEKA
ncbi:hypothetical protein [Streptomyces sp. AN091965]|uniref:hypothetical protein n=1 Tax=Streptomyces sp. AN091965 TaxID=2927803 RepID=UPI001F6101E9|nr:hypothetical protein [Streptomyces sp. AN091965]MCI3928812.1 hypothetical protein [Streptomyces sp. AN091965]